MWETVYIEAISEYSDLVNIIYDEKRNLFILLVNDNGTTGYLHLLYSSDLINWEINPQKIKKDGYAQMQFDFNENLLLSADGFALKDVETEHNRIDNLSADSDIGLSLKVGENSIISNCECVIKYRQKYIGV